MVRENLETVEANIRKACANAGRSRDEVTLIAVSKTKPVSMLMEAYDSGIRIFGRRIKSLVFSTDVAIIKNINADAVIAVYPFTPQPAITQAILSVSEVPVFAGVGGGLTNGQRSASIAAYAEHQGAFGLVCNTFITEEAIRAIKETVEIPLVYTVVSEQTDVAGKLAAGVDFLNVSGAARTPDRARGRARARARPRRRSSPIRRPGRTTSAPPRSPPARP